MELRDLRTFTTVVEVGGITRAAERLHLVQSAVSQSVKRLERELGVVLLERRPEGVRATQAGAALADYARAIHNGVARAEREMAAFRDLERGNVWMGIMPTATPLMLRPLLQSLREVHPGLSVSPREGTAGELMDLVRVGSLDLAVLLAPVDTAELRAEPLGSIPLAVVVPPGHALAERRQVRLEELRNERWVSFPPGNPGRRWLEEACEQRGFQPVHVTEVETLAQQKIFVAVGDGIAMLPVGAAEPEVTAGELAAIDFSPSPHVVLVCVDDPHQPESRTVEAVRRVLFESLGAELGRR